jgi:3D (Asp-Asp-Asp) domain-containing protein
MGLLVLALALGSAPAQQACRSVWVTGYDRTDPAFQRTYDGTPILTDEPIAAASWDVPLQSVVVIDGLGAYRVADRGGGLGSGRPTHIDLAVWSRAEALALTGTYWACIYGPEDAP